MGEWAVPTGPEWLAQQYGIEPAELARRVFRDLNEAAKTVDAARAMAVLLVRAVEQNAAPHPHLITNGFRITFGAVALTLRRFEDDWSRYIVQVASPVMWKKRSGAFFRLVQCTVNRPPWQAATGGTRHGQEYLGSCASAGA
jgi:hypothetical protein